MSAGDFSIAAALSAQSAGFLKYRDEVRLASNKARQNILACAGMGYLGRVQDGGSGVTARKTSAMAHGAGFGWVALSVGALAVVAGCASTPVGQKGLLEFLDQPPVSVDQVRQHLGEPHAMFEQERVLAYRLSQNTSGYYLAPHKSGWDGVQYDLIIVLDDHNAVQKHGLVVIRPL